MVNIPPQGVTAPPPEGETGGATRVRKVGFLLRFLGRRLVTYAVMLFIATSAAFLLAAWQFDPGRLFTTRVPRPSQAVVDRTLTNLGLNPREPVLERYWDWLTGVVTRWDWGNSPNGGSVNAQFAQRVGISFSLTLIALVLTLVIGVALGVWTASRQYRVGDRAVTSFSYLTFVLPAPVAYLAVQLLAIHANSLVGSNVLYVTGISDPTVTGFWPSLFDMARHYVVPTVAMTVFGYAGYQVSQRQFLLDNVNADFVRTARATGLTRNQAIRRHALRVSFIPTAQSIAFTIPALFIGSYFAEAVFNWPGLGLWSVQAMTNQDVSAATAMVAYGALIFAVGAVLADVAIVLVDPRVRVSR